MTNLPLEGIRIIEFGSALAGPFGPRMLADHGAEVIKVESSKRPDTFRTAGPRALPEGSASYSTSFGEFNRNKKAITVDMNTERGRGIVRRLIKISDVVLENYSVGVMNRWKLDYPSLREIKPDIIMVDTQGLGQTGLHRHHVTLGPNLMPLIGMTYAWGYPDSPKPVGAQIAHPDYVSAAHAALAILAALHYRQETGEGQCIDLAQAEAAASLMGPIYMDYLVNGRIPQPLGNRRPYAAPHGCYRCQGEDRWCVIAVETEEEWESFCHALGDPPWCRDPRFVNTLGRIQNADELDRLIEQWTMERSPHEVMETLQKAGVAAGAVQSGEDLYFDRHLRERGLIVELEHPGGKKISYPGLTIGLSETPGAMRRCAPLLGEDNEYVYGDLLGMSQEERASLVAEGILV